MVFTFVAGESGVVEQRETISWMLIESISHLDLAVGT